MTELMNELITEVFVEQPLALPGSDNYSLIYLKKTEYNSRKFNTFQKKIHNIFTGPIFGQKKTQNTWKRLDQNNPFFTRPLVPWLYISQRTRRGVVAKLLDKLIIKLIAI